MLLLVKYKKKFDEAPKPDYSYTPIVSVVIPAYNEEKDLPATMKSILNLNYPRDKLDIIIVDDGSTDRTYEIAKAYERYGVRVFRQPNRGKAAALNYGLRYARGEFIATMDVDSFVESNIIYKLLAYFDSPKVGAVTPAVKVKEDGTLLNSLQKYEYLYIIFIRRLQSFIDSVQVTPGPFSMFRASALREVGGFDENSIVEDNEIALNLQKHNYIIRTALNAEVITIVPRTLKDLIKQRIRWHRGGLHNAWKYRSIFRPSYGDLGLFLLPLNIFYFILLFLALYVLVSNFFFGVSYSLLLGWDAYILGIGPIAIAGFITFLMSIFFLFMVFDFFEVKDVNPVYLVVYFFFYWYLMAVYNLAVVWKEIKREPPRW
ncbi:MAG: glycosyltransferase [Candidatus Asgardarchaeia archaeon]